MTEYARNIHSVSQLWLNDLSVNQNRAQTFWRTRMRKPGMLCVVFAGIACAASGAPGARLQPIAEPQSVKPSQAATPKVITNDNLCSQLAGGAKSKRAQETAAAASQNDVFLQRITGRWRLSYFRRGNTSWWPGHGTAQPKTETDYLIGPRSVLVESLPEFRPSFITERYKFGSVNRVSENLVDVQFAKLSTTCAVGEAQTARFKLSPDGKTLEITKDPDDPEPTVEVLVLVDANWTEPASKDNTPR